MFLLLNVTAGLNVSVKTITHVVWNFVCWIKIVKNVKNGKTGEFSIYFVRRRNHSCSRFLL